MLHKKKTAFQFGEGERGPFARLASVVGILVLSTTLLMGCGASSIWEEARQDMDIFMDYRNAASLAGHLAVYDEVVVQCIIIDSSSDLWYRLTVPTDPSGKTQYAKTDNFYNRDLDHPGNTRNKYSPQASLCPDSPSKMFPPVDNKTTDK